MLIEHLPPESAVNTAIRNRTPEELLRQHAGDPTRATWSGVETLLATLIDEMRQLEWLYASAHTDKALIKPEPIKRPGVSGSGRKLRAISLTTARKLDPRLRGLTDDEVRDRMKRLGRG